MNFNYNLTSNFLNTISEFYRLHGALYAMGNALPWKNELEQMAGDRAALAAVSLDSEIDVDKLIQTGSKITVPDELLFDFTNYRQTKDRLGEFFIAENNLDLSIFDQVHQSVMGLKYEHGVRVYREKEKMLPKVVFANGIYQKLDITIKTPVAQITDQLNELNSWMSDNYRTLNPVVMTACVYFALAKIHPYLEGNGRTAKILVHGVLYQHMIDTNNVLLIEEYYLKNRGQYYDIISQAIESGDLTQWLDFFASALLYGALEAVKLLQKLSGGSIDLLESKYIQLTTNQMSVIDALQGSSGLSGAEIGRKLGFSRQYVSLLLTELIQIGLVKNTAQGRNGSYSLNSGFSD